MNNARYTPDEILQIQIDFYNCQAVFDPEVSPGEQLTFETTISDWMSICDLVGAKELAKYYHGLFKLSSPIIDLENILSAHQNNLSTFCGHIAEYATKQVISPIVMMGKSCMTAAIYKTLISNLKERGVDTQGLKPSSAFTPLFDKYGSILLEEVNKLAPGSLTRFEYQENGIVKIGVFFNLVFFFSIIIIPIVWHFHWTLLISLALGIITILIGQKFKPKKQMIGGCNTIRELILGMVSRITEPI